MSREICYVNFCAARTEGREWVRTAASHLGTLRAVSACVWRGALYSLLLLWICPGSNLSTSLRRVWEGNRSVLVVVFIPWGWREPQNNLLPPALFLRDLL